MAFGPVSKIFQEDQRGFVLCVQWAIEGPGFNARLIKPVKEGF
jgi:hypothetical protein